MPLAPFDDHTLALLEYPKVLEMIAGYAVSEPGRTRIAALHPSADPDTIRERSALLAEATDLNDRDLLFHVSPFPDLTQVLRRLAPAEAVVSGEELRDVLLVLVAARGVQAAHRRVDIETPRVRDLVGRLCPPAELAEVLQRCIGEEGEVLDRASPDLASVRRRIRTTEEELQSRLHRLLNRPEFAAALQDRFVTTRNGRYVIPVRADASRHVPGVVHDRSDTGRTVFLEPMEVLPLGNELNDLASLERVEVRRVLRALSEHARSEGESLQQTCEALLACDLLQALARFGGAHRMIPPPIVDPSARLSLQQARHPVLERTLAIEKRSEELVPLDFDIGGDLQALLVTGSNTGGKTVILKTAGLIVAMAQAGLPVPVGRGSEIGVFTGLFAEIGDEQSIEQSLSTFSSHVAGIVRILDAAPANSLVLLDELGAGTDPAEGGALACAVLQRLQRQGTITMASTHLGQPKAFVHRTPGMENAAVTFDPATLRPTYRLTIGQPGSSHALAISSRLGMPDDVMTTAREHLEDDEARLESLLSDLAGDRALLEQNLQQAETARLEADRDRKTAHEQLRELRESRKSVLRKAYSEAEAIVDRARRQMDEAVREARASARQAPERVREARQRLDRKKEGVATALRQVQPEPPRPLPWDEIQEGRDVWIPTLNSLGTVRSLDPRKRRVKVTVGTLLIELSADEVQAAPAGGAEKTGGERPAKASYFVAASLEVPLELSLRGQRVDPALSELDRYLNEAAVARFSEVRVVHGKGTGVLRTAVHQMLQHHPLVESFRLADPEQGGFGATVVRLRT